MVRNVILQVGSGSKFKFWEDEWLAYPQLKVSYSRNYNNFMFKDGPVGRFGRWTRGGWEWVFCWRRKWFEWEKPMVEDFMAILL